MGSHKLFQAYCNFLTYRVFNYKYLLLYLFLIFTSLLWIFSYRPICIKNRQEGKMSVKKSSKYAINFTYFETQIKKWLPETLKYSDDGGLKARNTPYIKIISIHTLYTHRNELNVESSCTRTIYVYGTGIYLFFLPALDGLNLDRNQLWASLTYITPGSKYQLPLKGTLFFDLITKFMCGVCVCALVKKEAVLHFTPLSISCRRKSPGFHRSPWRWSIFFFKHQLEKIFYQ